ncbi:hypothetical protein [Deinococcus marmoris]|uniref:hypothetical protein n=1 Tax=Deinococcus marmoris TaxID=249408 RepID=UPI000494E488|nr:hypothetical protein [Deinococcus marmoris]
MNFWRWLITPDPDPGFNRTKLLKLVIRVVLFATVATLISSLLALTPLRPYLDTWWGSLIFILILYVPMARFLLVDSFVPRRGAGAGATAGKGGKSTLSSAQKRKERNRYAGVKKGPPKYGGRR